VPEHSTQHQRRTATREQLLAAAERVFAEKGYQGATIAAITAEAETGHGTFYLHFRNKDEVFLHVIETAMDDLYERSFAGVPGNDSRQLILRYLETFVRHGPIFRCVLSGSLASPVVARHWAETRSRAVARVEAGVRHWQEHGKIPDVDPAVLANVVTSMVEWSAVTQYLLELPPAANVPIETTADAIDVLWSRLFVPSPAT
jgi:AcrR family transcriptional regulator